MPKKLTTLEKAIKAAGGPTRLGKLLGIKPQAVSGWKSTGLPPARVIDVERASGIPRHELRPDIYPLEWHAAEAPPQEMKMEHPVPELAAGAHGSNHFSRFKYLRRNHFPAPQEVDDHIAALREEWDRR